jgi:hypothetical protein
MSSFLSHGATIGALQQYSTSGRVTLHQHNLGFLAEGTQPNEEKSLSKWCIYWGVVIKVSTLLGDVLLKRDRGLFAHSG